jgi:RNA polymerase sigma factor (sigma-70 family)
MAGEGRLDADRLCRLYADQVYRFAAMVSNRDSDAEDLAQDALERAIRAIDRYDSLRGTVDAWLWRIVVNTARDRGRVEQRNWMLLERISALLPRQSLDADQMTDSALLDDDLLDALRRLPRRARALIALRFGADLPPSGDHAGSQSLAKWPASVAAACTATAPWKALSSAGVFSPDRRRPVRRSRRHLRAARAQGVLGSARRTAATDHGQAFSSFLNRVRRCESGRPLPP